MRFSDERQSMEKWFLKTILNECLVFKSRHSLLIKRYTSFSLNARDVCPPKQKLQI